MAPRKRPAKKSIARAVKSAAKLTEMPPLKWGGYGWEGEITLPAWRGIQPKFGLINKSKAKKASLGKVKLSVDTPEAEKSPPSLAQRRAYHFLVKHQGEIRDIILNAARKAWPRILAAWNIPDPAADPFLSHVPKRFASAEQLKSHIGLGSVYLMRYEKAGLAHVGYGFECTWDPEHGLGVATHRKRVLEVGDEEVAFMETAYREDLRDELRNAPVPNELKLEDLNQAVLDGNRRWVAALLNAGAAPDKRYLGPDTVTAIDLAVSQRQSAILKLLLKYATRPLNNAALNCAHYVGNRTIIKLLTDYDTECRRTGK